MSSEAKLVWRAIALSVSAFTSGYFARMIDNGRGNAAAIGFLFSLCVATFVLIMMIFDTE